MKSLALALVLAVPAVSAPVEEPRRVVVLYRSDRVPDGKEGVQSLPFHTRGEIWLDHLGFVADYLDASKPLPPPSYLSGARAVVTWFSDEAAFEDPKPLCRWLTRAMERGLPWVAMGRTGLRTPRKSGFPVVESDCALALRTLGVEVAAPRPVDGMSVRIAHEAPGLFGFERKPDPSETGSVPAVRLLPGATSLLTLEFSDGGEPRSSPVALTPRGALALDPFLLYSNREVEPPQLRWVLDPMAFLEAALRARGLPRPDVTTLSGRRIVMYRVDGDGFFNVSELDRRSFAGQVFLREVLERRPDLPFSVSLISGYYSMALYRSPEALTLSKLVVNRPHVEAAAHGHSHPLVWSSGTVALTVPRYRYDPEMEIAGSARRIKELFLPPQKPLSVYQWTGDSLPSEEELKIAASAGLLGINGGGGRFDDEFPSYAYLYPMARTVGSMRQVYAPGYNENDFTGLWTGPYYGYKTAIETFRRSGSPRRLKPVDAYVHFYTAEKYASLKAFHEVLDWTEAQPLIPVWESRYIRAAVDFTRVRILREGRNRFILEDGPALRTVRFDSPSGTPVISASKGIVGFKREGDSLFVHLDETSRREIVLGAAPGPGPWLEDANFEVEGWAPSDGGARFRKKGWGKAEATFAGLSPGRVYRLRSGGAAASGRAGPDGRLRLVLPGSKGWRPAREAVLEPVR